MKLLLLEDNSYDADLTARHIKQDFPDSSLERASTLKEARNLIKKMPDFQVVLVDINLPDGSGLELLLEIREQGLPMVVIVLTGSGDEELAVSALQFGADDYLQKKDGNLPLLSNAISYHYSNLSESIRKRSQMIKVLYLEHHDADIDLTIRHFKKHVPQFQFQHASRTKDAFKMLGKDRREKPDFDLLLMDYQLPGINALEVIKTIRQEYKLDLPIVVVTGQGNEEIAIQALKVGADDYLVKRDQYLIRLPSLLRSVFHKHVLEKQKKALAESEQKYRLLANNAGDVIFTTDLDYNFTYVSPAVVRLLGYTPEDLIKLKMTDVLNPDSYEEAADFISKADMNFADSGNASRDPLIVEFELIRKDESLVWAEIKVSLFLDENENLSGILGIARDISRRKHFEQKLKHSQEEYKMFFEEDITADYISSTDGKLLNCNPAFLELLGFKTKEEALSFDLNKVYSEKDLRLQLIDELKSGRKIVNREFDLVRMDGKEINVTANILGHFDENHNLVNMSGYLIDSTDRKRAIKELKKLSRAVTQSPASTIITDTEGNIEYVNPKFCELSGFSYEESIGKNPRILKSGHTSDLEYKELWNTITSGKEWNGEFLNNHKDGSSYWESASISPITDDEGVITHYLAIKEDITARKHQERDLILAKEKAEESDRLKTAFLQNISHEIRTPMNGIMGFSRLLKKSVLSSEKREMYLNVIHESSQRMLHTIEDIVEMSKLQTGLVEMKNDYVKPSRLLESLYNFFKPNAVQKSIDLLLKTDLPPEKVLIADEIKLNAILNNLIINAFKFTNEGSIEIGCRIDEEKILFYVSDTGIGIPEDMQQHIFDRFIKDDSSINILHEGTGLGLSISKAYAEIMDGRVWMESNEAGGSNFYVEIPHRPVDSRLEEGEEFIVSPDYSQKLLMIVEDDECNYLYLKELLNATGINIIHTVNGIDAIEKVKEFKGIELILMDLRIPGLNGYEATKEIKSINPTIKVIAQSSFVNRESREKAIQAGCDEFISKPLTKESLFGALIKHL